MNLENYKRVVRELLEKRVGTTRADTLMKEYEEDFQMFLEENWLPGIAAQAMLLGY